MNNFFATEIIKNLKVIINLLNKKYELEITNILIK